MNFPMSLGNIETINYEKIQQSINTQTVVCHKIPDSYAATSPSIPF